MSFEDYKGRGYGVVWGLLVCVLGILIANFLVLVDKFLNVLLEVLIWVFLFPLKIFDIVSQYTGVEDKFVLLGVAGVVGWLVWPVAFRVFNFILSIFRRSPL